MPFIVGGGGCPSEAASTSMTVESATGFLFDLRFRPCDAQADRAVFSTRKDGCRTWERASPALSVEVLRLESASLSGFTDLGEILDLPGGEDSLLLVVYLVECARHGRLSDSARKERLVRSSFDQTGDTRTTHLASQSAQSFRCATLTDSIASTTSLGGSTCTDGLCDDRAGVGEGSDGGSRRA